MNMKPIEIMIFLVFIAIVALIVYGVYWVVRRAVRDGRPEASDLDSR